METELSDSTKRAIGKSISPFDIPLNHHFYSSPSNLELTPTFCLPQSFLFQPDEQIYSFLLPCPNIYIVQSKNGKPSATSAIPMGSEGNLSKRRYDISMSRRTRKPVKVEDEDLISVLGEYPLEEITLKLVDEEKKENPSAINDKSRGSDHKSLKQLINGDEKPNTEPAISGDGLGKARSSLGQHFNEEENRLQLVIKQPQNGLQGVKLTTMVGNFFRHFLSSNGDQPMKESRKKSLLRLKK